jgi:hypothetical protein
VGGWVALYGYIQMDLEEKCYEKYVSFLMIGQSQLKYQVNI